jgi:outer membrane protein assembly factor BamB
LLLYNPSLGQNAAKWIQLDSPLACAVTAWGDGFVVPLTIGQVFYLGSADGSKLAAPFQTTLTPQKVWHYKPASVVDGTEPQFAIADGNGKIYLVGLGNEPRQHLRLNAQADAGPHPIESRLIVLGDSALAVAGSSHLIRVKLPSLEPAGNSSLPAPVVWGPYRVGDSMLFATANNQLMAVTADGQIKWQAPIEHGDLTGAPLSTPDSVLLAYKKGIIERCSLSAGKSLAVNDVEQPLASGPVLFLQRLVVAVNDGTLLVIDQP